MQAKFTFRQMKYSEAVALYANDQMERLEKFEYKPMTLNFIFSVQKGVHRTEVHVAGSELHLEAQAETDDMYSSIDEVMDRLYSQLSKYKHKVQNHKRPEISNEGMLERLQPDLHYEHAQIYGKSRKKKAV